MGGDDRTPRAELGDGLERGKRDGSTIEADPSVTADPTATPSADDGGVPEADVQPFYPDRFEQDEPPQQGSARRTRGLMHVLQMLFAAWTVVAGFGAATELVRARVLDVEARLPSAVVARFVEANNARVDVLGVAMGIGLLTTWLALAWWMSELNRNLRAHGSNRRFGSGWAFGAWLIPVFNLWMPKQYVNDLYRAAAARAEGPDGSRAVPAIAHAWWTSWLATLFATSVLGGLGESSDLAGAYVGAGFFVLVGTAAVLGSRMVAGLTGSAWPSDRIEPSSESPLESSRGRRTWARVAALPALGLLVVGAGYLAWDVSGDTEVDLDDPRRFETLTRGLAGTAYANVPNEQFPAAEIDRLAAGFCGHVDEGRDILAALEATVVEVVAERSPLRDDFFFVGALAAYAVTNHCNRHAALLQEAMDANG